MTYIFVRSITYGLIPYAYISALSVTYVLIT